MKIISVRAVPNAKRNEIAGEEKKLRVYLRAKPDGGEANRMLIEVLSEHFGVAKGKIRILKGMKSREKIVSIG